MWTNINDYTALINSTQLELKSTLDKNTLSLDNEIIRAENAEKKNKYEYNIKRFLHIINCKHGKSNNITPNKGNK